MLAKHPMMERLHHERLCVNHVMLGKLHLFEDVVDVVEQYHDFDVVQGQQSGRFGPGFFEGILARIP